MEFLVRGRRSSEIGCQPGPHIPSRDELAVGDIESFISAFRMGKHKYCEINYEASVTDIVCAVPKSLVVGIRASELISLQIKKCKGKVRQSSCRQVS